LLSDDGGKTFQEWVNMLGGKSVNGVPVIFPYEDSVPYHLYWKVLNAKHHGVPQNRERVFLIGIRDDQDNQFQFPKEEHLSKRLKDVLENQVEDKYFLSQAAINKCLKSQANENMLNEDIPDKSRCIVAGYYKQPFDGQYLKVTNFQGSDISNTIRTGGKGSMTDKHNWDTIKIKSATSKGYEEATEGNSINFSVPNSETRRGRVGKGVAQTLDTACNQGVIMPLFQWGKGSRDGRMVYDKEGISPCMTSAMGMGGGYTPSVIKDYKIRRLTPRECFRLMDFPDTFTWKVSDSQAYKQAGNSIVVNVLYKILKQLPL
jgi:DNA (cytosine-5)-methyltransferase 1